MSLIQLQFVDIFMWPLCKNQPEWAIEVKGRPVSRPATCIITHSHTCMRIETQIIASLWDRENAKATVNVKTRPTSKTHGSPFTPQRRSLFFPWKISGGNIRLQETSAEPPELWNYHLLRDFLSPSLFFCSLHSQRYRHRQNTLSTACTSETSKNSQTCLILSGWHSKIHRKSLGINFTVVCTEADKTTE